MEKAQLLQQMLSVIKKYQLYIEMTMTLIMTLEMKMILTLIIRYHCYKVRVVISIINKTTNN